MAKKEVKKVSDLNFDKRNANKHSEYGMQRLEKSINKIGLGRSILISDDNEIIAGNGVTESAVNAGIEKVRVIETDGTEIIAVKRTDIKSGTKEFYEMALSDNIIAKENIVMDAEVTNAICEEYEIEEYKVDTPPNIDYSLLEDDEETENMLKDMANGVKKAIQIEYHPDHYQEAYEIIKFWRERGAYVGKMILDYLNAEKAKL